MADALDILTSLQNCWCEALAGTVNGSPAECCVSTSASIVDCCAGRAWVKMTGAYPSKSFPSQYGQPENCRIDTWAMNVELGISRCAPQPCQVTGPVCCEEDLLAVQGQIDDWKAMRRVFACCLPGLADQFGQPLVRGDEIIVGQYRIVEDGGCTFATIQATIRVADFCGCE